ncbi:MAG TPA: hypothetical protein VLV89_00615 [Candidatus Acidoferrum sp.]|nr:hypothetical protein [Candidatus Acidoferrum sp.]
MKKQARLIAALGLTLIFPAALFMAALVVRNFNSLPFNSAEFAQRIVMSYAGKVWTLWVLLIAMPFAAFITGTAALLGDWGGDVELRNAARQSFSVIRAHPARLIVAITTVMAAGILAIVAVHLLAN